MKKKITVSRRAWDAALATAAAKDATPEARVGSALVVIDSHLNGIVRFPATWGDTMSAEIAFCELLFLRAVLVGAEPMRWGGEALSRAKQRRFKSDNGPASNWIARDDFAALTPMLKKALAAERKRMGVHSAVTMRRVRKTKGAQ